MNWIRSWCSHVSFRRVVTSNRFIPEIDGFRFLAIAVVIVVHTFLQCTPVSLQARVADWLAPGPGTDSLGSRAVCLFFTISGFILALPFARHRLQGGSSVRLGSYFKRRLTRLEPPYVLILLLRFPLVLHLKGGSAGVFAGHLLASILYVHTIVYREFSTLNPPAWSLEIEVQFYILAPLLAGIFLVRSRLWRRSILIGAMLAGALILQPVAIGHSLLVWSILAYSQNFVAGFLLCDLYLSQDLNQGRWALPRWLWDIIGVTSILWILFTRVSWAPAALPFATLALYLAGFHGGVVRAFFAFRPISLIGGMCYSIYLTHTTILSLLSHATLHCLGAPNPSTWGILFTFLAAVVSTVFVGTVYFLLIERPCMDPEWPHKLAEWFRRGKRNPDAQLS
jgi:peptidoglycan/LPS O-acetylase OafA/YrhL